MASLNNYIQHGQHDCIENYLKFSLSSDSIQPLLNQICLYPCFSL